MRYPQTDREFQEAEEARERTRKSDEADFDNYGGRQNNIYDFAFGADWDPQEVISKPAPVEKVPQGVPDEESNDEDYWHGHDYWDLTDADLRPDDKDGKEAA